MCAILVTLETFHLLISPLNLELSNKRLISVISDVSIQLRLHSLPNCLIKYFIRSFKELLS
jgi:hypothetical protein